MKVNKHFYSLGFLLFAVFKIFNDAHKLREKMIA